MTMAGGPDTVGEPVSRGRAARWVALAVVALVLNAGWEWVQLPLELRAQLTDRWSYSELMPQVWIIGLSPLVQLPLLGVVSNAIVRPWRMSPTTGG